MSKAPGRSGSGGGLVYTADSVGGCSQGIALISLSLGLFVCEMGMILVPAWFDCYEHYVRSYTGSAFTRDKS